MSQTFIKSTLILSIATLISKVLGSIFRIPLQNIAGDEVLGIFTLVYPVYMAALIISVAGIPIAISKLIAEARVKNNEQEVRDIYLTASIFGILFGLISFTLMTTFSSQIANTLGGKSTQLSIIIVSTTLLIAPYMAVYRGYFQGFDDMRPTAYSQVFEQLVRVILILSLAWYLVGQQQNSETVAGGVMVGSSVGALISLIYLRITFMRSHFRPKSNERYNWTKFVSTGKRILIISLPICVGALTMALLNLVDSLTIPHSLKLFGHSSQEINYLYGIYGRGLSLVQITTVFSTSLVLPLIPLITKTMVKNDLDKTKDVIEKSHHLTHLTSWPAAAGILALVLPINLALFTDLEGSIVLGIIGVSSLFTSLTVLGTGILQGMDKSFHAAIVIVVGSGLKFLLNWLLVGKYGLTGAAVSTFIVYVVLFIVNTYLIYKKLSFSFFKKETFAIIVSSIIMCLAVGVPTMFIDFGSASRLFALAYVMIGIILGAIIYFAFVFLLKGIKKEELMGFPVIGALIRKVAK